MEPKRVPLQLGQFCTVYEMGNDIIIRDPRNGIRLVIPRRSCFSWAQVLLEFGGFELFKAGKGQRPENAVDIRDLKGD